MSAIGDRLKILRENKGWSKKYVADRLALKQPSTYSNWEYGLRDPDSETISKLADLFDTSTDYLLGRTDEKDFNQPPKDKAEFALRELVEKYNIDLSEAAKKDKLEQIIQLVFDDADR